MASELHEHYATLQKSANQIVGVLGIDIPEASSQSTSQPAVSQSEIPVVTQSEIVRQVDDVSPVHSLDTPERRIQENVVSSSPLTKRGSDDEMSTDDAILDEKEDVKLKQINHSA